MLRDNVEKLIGGPKLKNAIDANVANALTLNLAWYR